MREPEDEKENQSYFLNTFIYLHIVSLDQRHYTKLTINNKDMISEDQVKHVAKLARLNLSDKQVKKFAGQLGDVLDYAKILEEADTSSVEETSQVTGLTNVSQSDEIFRKCSGDELLQCSPLPKERHQIRVKPAIKK
jgi:aspartyl-tRNA(Asn)/glutamyl-tRNA(Gln) amidotransferase subunit C